jgi:hypothetical protein
LAERPRAFRTFVEDLARALGVWKWNPLLPVLSVAIAAGPYIVEEISAALAGAPECYRSTEGCGPLFVAIPFVTLMFSVFFAGWFGTERIWYLRSFRGQTLRRAEIWPLTSAFRWRYIALGFLAGLVMIPALLPVALLSGRAALIGFLVWIYAIDAALTFVTPALAFSTRSVFAAIRIAFRLTRQTWPGSALYLFIPPLAARVAAAVIWNDRLSLAFAVVADVIAVLLNLWFKGATARFYLRYHEIGEDGAAYFRVEDQGGEVRAPP